MTQLQLQIFRASGPSQNEEVLEFLRAQPGWHTAKTLSAALHLGDRDLRAAAEASGGQIISGQLGYKHISHATGEEIKHAANWLESQAQRMAKRAAQIRERGLSCPRESAPTL